VLLKLKDKSNQNINIVPTASDTPRHADYVGVRREKL